jgi:hypothetical protein
VQVIKPVDRLADAGHLFATTAAAIDKNKRWFVILSHYLSPTNGLVGLLA